MKKIAIFENGWGRYISYAWVDGCRKYIAEHNLDVCLYVFNTFGDYNYDYKFNIGEYNLYNLPDLKHFDAIILEVTNVAIPKYKEELIEKIRESKVPAVSLVEKIDGFYFVGIDNYKAMFEMVDHVINVHHAKKINFVAGPHDSYENINRIAGYKDALKKNGIPVENERIYSGDFSLATGTHAFTHFWGKRLMPEAMICANDNIAVGISHEAQLHGMEIPKDLIVTGFDNFDKAAFYTPRITTIDFARDDISYSAMQIIHKLWLGESVDAEMLIPVCNIYQESCGCPECNNTRTKEQYIIDKIFAEEEAIAREQEMNQFKRSLINCNNFIEFADKLPEFIDGSSFEAQYLVVNSDMLEGNDVNVLERKLSSNYRTEGYPEKMSVLFASDAGGRRYNCKIRNRFIELEDDRTKSGDVFFFSPIHFRDREVGYSVFKNGDILMGSSSLFEILNVMSDSMENLFHRMVLSDINKQLSVLYLKDSLTGLYNRMAYSQLATPLYENCIKEGKPLSVLFLDMDMLKYVNDNFGHDVGNVAIKAIATTISSVCPPNSLAMRYGGDEFVILIPDCDEEQVKIIIDNIQIESSKAEQRINGTFPIESSIGYCVSKAGMKLNECINNADAMMYQIKKERKVNRDLRK